MDRGGRQARFRAPYVLPTQPPGSSRRAGGAGVDGRIGVVAADKQQEPHLKEDPWCIGGIAEERFQQKVRAVQKPLGFGTPAKLAWRPTGWAPFPSLFGLRPVRKLAVEAADKGVAGAGTGQATKENWKPRRGRRLGVGASTAAGCCSRLTTSQRKKRNAVALRRGAERSPTLNRPHPHPEASAD
jgi:hypothetical protein